MGTTRENKYRESEYTEGKYLICRVEGGKWQPFEMAEFDGVPLEYDPQTISDTDQEFDTLRDARAWCKAQNAKSAPVPLSENVIAALCGGRKAAGRLRR
jgi:hypothetical protein